MLGGPIVHVAARNAEAVELWVESGANSRPRMRTFRVFGASHEIADGALVHRGTTLTAGGRLVWHLYEYVTTGEGISS